MKSGKFTLVLPGDHWGDLPRGLDSGTAANLAACWTALWHPRLLVGTRKIPSSVSVAELLAREPTPEERVLLPRATPDQEVADSLHTVIQLEEAEHREAVWPRLASEVNVALNPTDPGTQELAALGYAYLQVEMLTRAMHYDGLLRHEQFNMAAVEAAEAALAGEAERLATRLDDAYDLLMQARNHYYPVDFYLADVGLVSPAACDERFVAACQSVTTTNYLVTGSALRELAETNPAALEALREAIEEGRAAVCGGSDTDRPLASLTAEEMLADMRRGLATCQELLGSEPAVFAHYDGPLAPLAPGLLYRLGYLGVIQANFAGHRTPRTLHNRTAWCGPDGIHIESLNALPVDTGDARAMLELAFTTSRSMDYEMAATLLLAGWPGHRSQSYDDLCEVARRSSVLGRMIKLDDYFDQTTSYDHAGPLDFDDYPDPPLLRSPQGEQDPKSLSRGEARIATLARLAGSESATPTTSLVVLLGAQESPQGEETGRLVLNGSSFTREAPGFGWQWYPPGRPRVTGEGTSLISGTLELHIDASTGGISAVRQHGRRGNLLSQRLVLLPPPGKAYAVLDEFQIAIDEVEQKTIDGGRLAIVARARLVDREGEAIARLRQTTSLDPYSSRVDIEVEVEGASDDSHHWRIASQVAFRDDAPLRRAVQGLLLPTRRSRVVTPCLQVASEVVPLAIVSDRALRHHRHHEQRIDTLLVEHPAMIPRARLSYVIGARYPAHSALALTHPGEVAQVATTSPRQTEGWWLNLGARNVVATYCEVEEHGDDALLRLRLLETEGRSAAIELRSWRPFSEAQQVDFRGQAEQLLKVTEGVVHLSMAPYEWLELIAAWEV